jgi:predicted PurR-regulated permease PerM
MNPSHDPKRNKRILNAVLFLFFGLTIYFWIFCFGSHGYAQQPDTLITSQPSQPISTNNSPSSYPQITGSQPVPVIELERQLNEYQQTLSGSARDYQDFLKTEMEKHTSYMQWYYECSLKVLSGFVVLIGAILVLLRAKTGEQIREIVEGRINSDVDAHISKAVKQLTEEKIDNLAAQANSRITELKKEYESKSINIIKIASILARACVVLNTEKTERNDQERRDVLKLLKQIEDLEPTNRSIAVFRGRIFRQLDDLAGAIEALDDTISKLISTGKNTGQDYADLLYNKSCYVNLSANKQATESLREQLRNDAWELLKESIKIWSPNFADAQKDDDFQCLTNEVRTWASIKP